MGSLRSVGRFLAKVLEADTAVLVAVGVACWFGKWRTLGQYANALGWAGMGAILVGFLSVVGHWGGTRDFKYLSGRSVSAEGIPGRARQTVRDLAQVYAFMVLMLAVGLSLFGASALIWLIR